MGDPCTDIIIRDVVAAVMMPFFPDYARVHLGASPFVIGVIFALFPILVLFSSPLAGLASNKCVP